MWPKTSFLKRHSFEVLFSIECNKNKNIKFTDTFVVCISVTVVHERWIGWKTNLGHTNVPWCMTFSRLTSVPYNCIMWHSIKNDISNSRARVCAPLDASPVVCLANSLNLKLSPSGAFGTFKQTTKYYLILKYFIYRIRDTEEQIAKAKHKHTLHTNDIKL